MHDAEPAATRIDETEIDADRRGSRSRSAGIESAARNEAAAGDGGSERIARRIGRERGGAASGLKLPLRALAPKTGTPPLTFALIEPREFYFGTERPLRGELLRTTETVVDPFYLSVTEVSNQQFRKFIEETNDVAEEKLIGAADDLPDGGVAYPVRHVGHAQAASFCRWVSEVGRLPTEVEWELAACGGTDQPYPWGDGPDPSGRNCNLAHGGRQELMPVDAFPEGATPVGLLNMLGNVAEWCEESTAAGYRDAGDPGVGTNPVIRGGSFLEDPQNTPIRVTTRSHAAEQGAAHVGFRVLIPAKPRRP